MSSSLLKPRPESVARTRLDDVRSIFNERTSFSTDTVIEHRISLAEGGCLLPPHIGVQKALQDGVHFQSRNPFHIYPFDNVNSDFIEDIRRYYSESCNIPANDEDMGIVLGFGSSHIFDGLLSCICSEGDVIIAPESYYHSYADWPTKWNARLEAIKTDKHDGYKLTAEALEDWFEQNPEISDKTKCLILTNPTTTGALYTQEEMKDLASVIERRCLFVFCDEVFRGSEFEDKQTFSLGSLPNIKDYVLTAGSGSKTRGVADLRLGWACGPSHITDRIIDYMERTVTEIPLYLQNAGRAILATPQCYLDEAREEYQRRAELVGALADRLNTNLNTHFGTTDVSYFEIPYFPESGHYLSANMNVLRGFQRPDGTTIDNAADLTKFFYDPSGEDLPAYGVIFSSGHSKGHDDLVVYIAFAQLGYEDVLEASEDYQNFLLFKHQMDSSKGISHTDQQISEYAEHLGLDFAHAQPPNLAATYEKGHRILVECFDRVERAICTHLTPSPEFLMAHQNHAQCSAVQEASDGYEKSN